MRAIFRSPIFVALLVTLACWVVMINRGVDHVYWNQRFKNFVADPRPVAEGMVLVSLDGAKEATTQTPTTSTSKQAELLKLILAKGPRHVYFDLPTAQGVDDAGDAMFANAVTEAGKRLTIVLRAEVDVANHFGKLSPPGRLVAPDTQVAASIWYINFQFYAQSAPASVIVGGRTYPSVAALEAGISKYPGRIVPDFRLSPKSVPIIDANAILAGKVSAESLSGKTVFVSATSPNLGTSVGYYGHGKASSVFADIAGIRGMLLGPVIDFGPVPLLILFLLLVLIGGGAKGKRAKILIYSGLFVTILVLPALLRDMRIAATNDLALIAMAVYGPARLWQRWRRQVELTNGSTGLPNIDALTSDGIPAGYDVVAAAISQYEQMLATLPRDLHGECARQIARRLSLASGDSKVYATDNGHFIWLEEPRPIESQVNHLEGLKALFSAPLVIGEHILDTNIHFGLDRIATNSATRRIQAALASAAEAESKGKLYEEFEQRRLAEAPWELSLHARIDEGLRNGDIWLALQVQRDLRTGRMFGAEALIRWNDPDRGAIPPDAFILAAERAGRIEAITYWVMERAIEASKQLNVLHHPFHISVNLSARMADHPGLLDRCREIVERTKFDCSLMTFEVTETFSMANREVAKRNLYGLREMGFRLSIDDFGTGQASLAYLAEIPSDEIKLDKRFIQAVVSDQRERLIVRSVIKLAHALGQTVVAEGVEDEETLITLRRMNCDIGQGYHIGRPIRLEDLAARLGRSEEKIESYT